MNNLVKIIEENKKVDYVKKILQPTLEDVDVISEIKIVLECSRNLFPWAKTIWVKPSQTKHLFNVEFVMNDDPTTTLLSDIYCKHKTKDWVPAKYGHDKPMINLLVDIQTLEKLINWYYSKLN
jgi:hypothetical protein